MLIPLLTVLSSNNNDQTPTIPKWEVCLSVILIFCAITCSFLLTKLVHKIHLLKFIPESGVTMFLGMILGLFYYWVLVPAKSSSGDGSNQLLMFDIRIFDYVILPAIIFESGYSLKKKGLFNNMATVITYAVVGTLISTLFIGFMVYVFARYARVFSVDVISPVEALVFGAIISAVDPVATLALLGQVFRVSESTDVPLIYNLIFGESVVNDAVAIVLFRILITFTHQDNKKFTFLTLLKIVLQFAYVSLGSVAIGLTVGIMAALFFKYVSLRHNTAVEVIVLAMIALSSYLFAEAATLSGIMSLFVCGIVCGRFVWYNLSEYSKLTTPQTFKALATAAESYVFLYLGISAFMFINKSSWRWGFIGIALMLCLLGRMLNIFPLTLVVNIWRRKENRIGWREAVFMWWNGLRGAIAFALALHTIDYGLPNADAIVTTTLVIVFFSVWVFGTTSLPMLKLLKLDSGRNSSILVAEHFPDQPSAILLINKELTKPDDQHSQQLTSYRQHSDLEITMTDNTASESTPPPERVSLLKRFDRRFLRPILRRKNDRTNPHLRDLLLGGAIPHSLKIHELQSEEYADLCSRLQLVSDNSSRNQSTTLHIVPPPDSPPALIVQLHDNSSTTATLVDLESEYSDSSIMEPNPAASLKPISIEILPSSFAG